MPQSSALSSLIVTRTRRALLHMRALLAEHHDPGLRPVPIPIEIAE